MEFLPASSRNARLDAQYVNDEVRTLADSTRAAHFNDRDFGTSLWQLSIKTTPIAGARGRGRDVSLWHISTNLTAA
jgi:hypothetical protein